MALGAGSLEGLSAQSRLIDGEGGFSDHKALKLKAGYKGLKFKVEWLNHLEVRLLTILRLETKLELKLLAMQRTRVRRGEGEPLVRSAGSRPVRE